MSQGRHAMSRRGHGKLSLFVLVDALGWQFARAHEFLSDILRFRYPVETVLGFSSAAIPTILSGEMPEVHAHWCLFRRAGPYSCFTWTLPLVILPTRLRENHRTRSLVATLTRAMFGISGYFCLYEVPISVLHRLDYVEKKNLWAPGALSRCRNIFDILTSESISYYSTGWRRSDEYRVDAASDAVSNELPRCSFVYLSELDAALHVFGLESRQTKESLAATGVRIRRLVAQAQKLYSSVELFVFSDHGMTPVTECHDLQSVIASSGLDRSRYQAFFDSTMVRFWPRDGEVRVRIEKVLAPLEYGRILSDADKAELGLRFKTNEYGEIIFVMNPGHLVVPSYVGSSAPKAMHGFHPSDEYSRACFLSSKELDSPPHHIRDLFSFFVTQLGLDVAGPPEKAKSRPAEITEDVGKETAELGSTESRAPQF
jgi:hypothetical protein